MKKGRAILAHIGKPNTGHTGREEDLAAVQNISMKT